ncbi:hypothetical protein [Ferruginibacter sp.]|nr:hypothetical protein [Ferruginibacter sp.]
MAKKKKPTKTNKLKLIKAADMIEGFSVTSSEKDTSDSPIQDILNVTDSYRIKNIGSPLTFNLIFKTKGVGAITNAVLHNAITSTDKPIVVNEKDSLQSHPIEMDTVANRQFLEMRSIVAATNLTPVPADLEVEFLISGGVEDKLYAIPAASFKEVGDQIVLEISIFFF